MLKHEPQQQRAEGGATGSPTAIPQTAAQAGLAPEEVARAVAAIEARRLEGAAEGRVDAAALDATLAELGLDVSAAAVLAEVEAQRKAAAEAEALAARQAALRRRREARQRAVATVFGSVLLLTGTVGWLRSQGPVASVAAGLPPVYSPGTVVYDNSDPDRPLLRTLAEVPEGGSVRVQFDPWDYVRTRSGQERVVRIQDYKVGAHDRAIWTVIKHGGRLYLRGHMVPATEGVLRGRALEVSRTPGTRGGTPLEPVNLSLDSLRPETLDWQGDDVLVVRDLRPDGNFRPARLAQ